MNSKFKIKIPEPCNENWDKMTLNEKGRFCLVCNKSVIDFTNKLPEEIQHYFIKNQGQKICGRFKNSQLDTIRIQIPSKVLFSQTQYHKIFLLALFITMGTSLFSCGTTNGNKQRIEKVEVIESTEIRENIEISELSKTFEKSDSITESAYKESETMGILDSDKFYMERTFPSPKNKGKKISFMSYPYREYEKNRKIIIEPRLEAEPYFIGGNRKFYTIFANEFKIPKNTEIKDWIQVNMRVEENGCLTYLNRGESIDKNIQKEIGRILKLSPKWKPGKSNGHNTIKTYSFIFIIQ